MSYSRPTLEEAEAIFIKSMSNLVWILALAIFAEIYFVSNSIAYDSSIFNSIKGIIVGALWLIALMKILSFMDKRWDKQLQYNKDKSNEI